MKRTLFLFGSIILSCLTAFCQQLNNVIKSPDGKICVTVTDDNGKPQYAVKYGDKVFIQPSLLGVVTNNADYSENLRLKNVNTTTIDENYSLPNIKQSNVHYVANEAVCKFYRDSANVLDVIFRVSNRDVAFRYLIHPAGTHLSCTITKELTQFKPATGSTTFLCPQAKPMGGFAGTSPSYETSYTLDDAMGKNGWGEGYTFPCLFKNQNDGWMLVSETGVDGGYCAGRLLGESDGTYCIGFPQAEECNGNGTVSPGISLPGKTPWRTITLGNTLANIVETTVPFDVVERKYEPSKNYTYGKGSWSWIIGMDASCNYNDQKKYIDFSAAMGYQSVLVDALWDTQIGRDKIAELAEYGAKKGVSLYLWYNSNGYWNDAFQSSRGIRNDPILRKKETKWMQQTGIKGIKVDFFGGDKQMMMQVYEGILSDANDYGLEVIFHGCTIPRGWERMYPNYAASEAVLASENLHFSEYHAKKEAQELTMHPFCRNAVGAMDWGGTIMNKYISKDNKSRHPRYTTDMFEIAAAYINQSNIQCVAIQPNNLSELPQTEIDLLKDVTTTWDETQFIDGYPMKYVVLARRHGDNWYVAGLNGTKEVKKLTLHLPMFAGKTVKCYADAEQKEVRTLKVNKKGMAVVTLLPQGGLLIK